MKCVRFGNPRVVILKDVNHLRLLSEDHLHETIGRLRYHLDTLTALDAQREDLLEVVPKERLLGGGGLGEEVEGERGLDLILPGLVAGFEGLVQSVRPQGDRDQVQVKLGSIEPL